MVHYLDSATPSNGHVADTIMMPSRSASPNSCFGPEMSSPSSPFHPPLLLQRNSSPGHGQAHGPESSTPSCMWGDCHGRFSSRSELAAHVNLVHLHPPSPTITGNPSLLQLNSQDNTLNDLSCHWADCSIFSLPSSIPGPSTGNQRDAALGVLAHHLLQDHLGFFPNFPLLGSSDIPAADAGDAQRPTDGIPTPPISPRPFCEIQVGTQHECSGTHACLWESCGEVFASCDELTAHITALHVGAGKPHYDCLWKDCNRHGDRGFASKQKICRHVQVRSFPWISYQAIGVDTVPGSLILGIALSSVRNASSISLKLRRYSNTCGDIRKKVSS
jgi:hypothetical protein